MLCHLPYLKNIIIFNGGNHEVFIDVEGEISNLASVAAMDELTPIYSIKRIVYQEFGGAVLLLLSRLSLPNSTEIPYHAPPIR